ncbi:MAG: hypothetical protein KGL63_10030, partial [Betaproteobacteria bacterium]|nr:hypothetical protein [Betaproteobacteria bacterium]
GAGKTISIVEARRPSDLSERGPADEIASRLGLPVAADGLVDWDVFQGLRMKDADRSQLEYGKR